MAKAFIDNTEPGTEIVIAVKLDPEVLRQTTGYLWAKQKKYEKEVTVEDLIVAMEKAATRMWEEDTDEE